MRTYTAKTWKEKFVIRRGLSIILITIAVLLEISKLIINKSTIETPLVLSKIMVSLSILETFLTYKAYKTQLKKESKEIKA